ncbi:hypothetical protein [Cyclobacterium plantarum]|uniref:hypothetical protein n=1 Tax=Cyclobacterium plantarum TaxID=2716263 RepID=UPI003F706F28
MDQLFLYNLSQIIGLKKGFESVKEEFRTCPAAAEAVSITKGENRTGICGNDFLQKKMEVIRIF